MIDNVNWFAELVLLAVSLFTGLFAVYLFFFG